MKAEDAIGHERDDRDENESGDPEGDVDGVVDIAPVRGNRRPPPRAVEVEQHRADRDQKQYQCDSHPRSILAIEGYGDELKEQSALSRWPTSLAPAPCVLPRLFDRSRHLNVTRSTRYDRKSSDLGRHKSRWYASSCASSSIENYTSSGCARLMPQAGSTSRHHCLMMMRCTTK